MDGVYSTLLEPSSPSSTVPQQWVWVVGIVMFVFVFLLLIVISVTTMKVSVRDLPGEVLDKLLGSDEVVVDSGAGAGTSGTFQGGKRRSAFQSKRRAAFVGSTPTATNMVASNLGQRSDGFYDSSRATFLGHKEPPVFYPMGSVKDVRSNRRQGVTTSPAKQVTAIGAGQFSNKGGRYGGFAGGFKEGQLEQIARGG